jgi:hypothetical protein
MDVNKNTAATSGLRTKIAEVALWPTWPFRGSVKKPTAGITSRIMSFKTDSPTLLFSARSLYDMVPVRGTNSGIFKLTRARTQPTSIV